MTKTNIIKGNDITSDFKPFSDLILLKFKKYLQNDIDDKTVSIELVRDTKVHSYMTICEVVNIGDDVSNINIGDDVLVRVGYFATLTDIFERHPNIDEDLVLIPSYLVSGIYQEDKILES